jgi:hypothetical protein
MKQSCLRVAYMCAYRYYSYIPRNTLVYLTNLLVSFDFDVRIIGTDACVLRYMYTVSSANGFGSLKIENTTLAEAAVAMMRRGLGYRVIIDFRRPSHRDGAGPVYVFVTCSIILRVYDYMTRIYIYNSIQYKYTVSLNACLCVGASVFETDTNCIWLSPETIL